MVFTSGEFVAFFIVALLAAIVFRQVRSLQKFYKYLLLVLSLGFYLIADPQWLFLLAISTILVYFFAGWVAKNPQSKLLFGFAIAFPLLILIVGKYFNLLATTALEIQQSLGFTYEGDLIQLILPLGISYYTFKAISYLFDIRRAKIKPGSLLDLANYLSFFPQIGAGPIQRYPDFAKNLNNGVKSLHQYQLRDVFALVLSGTFKKLILATVLFEAMVEILRIPSNFSTLDLLALGAVYWAFIFADFSGYTDFARAFSKLLGIEAPNNFNAPFKSFSLRDFWQRWHITLSTWLRDYLYIPLGGNRQRHLFNLFITMVIGGIWHGASWNFLLWGAAHGLGLVVNHYFRKKLPKNLLTKVISYLLTFGFISFTWVLFAITDFAVLGEYFRSIAANAGAGLELQLLTVPVILATSTAMFMGIYGPKFSNWLRKKLEGISDLNLVIGFVVSFCVIYLLSSGEASAFVYFSF